MSGGVSQQSIVSTLRSQLKRHVVRQSASVSCHGSLSGLLPDKAFQTGSIVEWTAEQSGSHAISVAVASVKDAISPARPLVIIDTRHHLYLPSLVASGIALDATLVIRPQTLPDALWAMEQALRCQGAAIVLHIGLEVPPRQASMTFRRFQLAAEHGQTLGMFVSHDASQEYSRWVDLRLRVEPLAASGVNGQRRLRVRLEDSRSHGRMESHGSKNVVLHLDDLTGQITHEAYRMPVVPAVATSAVLPLPTRA